MSRFKLVRSGVEWGLFYGVLTWLCFTTITNKTPNAGVWGMVVARIILGFLIAYFPLKFDWWQRGLIWGLVVQLVFSVGLALPETGFGTFFYAWQHGYVLMLITGLLFGVLIEFHFMRRQKRAETEAGETK